MIEYSKFNVKKKKLYLVEEYIGELQPHVEFKRMFHHKYADGSTSEEFWNETRAWDNLRKSEQAVRNAVLRPA